MSRSAPDRAARIAGIGYGRISSHVGERVQNSDLRPDHSPCTAVREPLFPIYHTLFVEHITIYICMIVLYRRPVAWYRVSGKYTVSAESSATWGVLERITGENRAVVRPRRTRGELRGQPGTGRTGRTDGRGRAGPRVRRRLPVHAVLLCGHSQAGVPPGPAGHPVFDLQPPLLRPRTRRAPGRIADSRGRAGRAGVR